MQEAYELCLVVGPTQEQRVVANLKFLSCHWLEGLRKPHKVKVQIASLLALNGTGDLTSTVVEC